MTSQSDSTPSHSGRPRDPQIDMAVLEATLTVLDESGYGQLAIEEVARRAGTTKPAIYRRWSNRPRLALAALATRLGGVETPDSGCTICDLTEGLNVFVAAFRRIHPDVLSPLLADCTADSRLHDEFMTTLFDPPRAAVARMLDHAVARGDLRADLDRGLILDMLGSLVYYRALFGHAPTTESEVDHAVEALLRGIATDYPALVEHSRQLTGDPQTHNTHA
ncbi:transcriptional regulator, TetR family [Actinopolyspora xinjiangensis]|uniref:Transcriptional regulator, TetR family n=1 Tax=Actinopolyspora xinjiangensis TaxID=405564 RepID=A0A1H0TG07_9ACTN|nr:TetR/AcrR family transcriptional regulator [Actinopolyspora xinjiangensis]SDP52929.1 transcriptional regulator, TetR family [Actinopolyspora xinjiangensis]